MRKAQTGANKPPGYDRNKARVETGFWPKIRANLGRIAFVEEAVAAYFCTLDPQTPLRVKAILLGALAYFIVPTDLVPDFIAGFGYTDDAAVLFTAIRSISGSITNNHREKARAALQSAQEPAA